jgi:hypothetical protein
MQVHERLGSKYTVQYTVVEHSAAADTGGRGMRMGRVYAPVSLHCNPISCLVQYLYRALPYYPRRSMEGPVRPTYCIQNSIPILHLLLLYSVFYRSDYRLCHSTLYISTHVRSIDK